MDQGFLDDRAVIAISGPGARDFLQGLVTNDILSGLAPGSGLYTALLSPQGNVNAVLDWELATLGDTLADLGWLVATWREPGEPHLFESPTGADGWARRDDLVRMYVASTGRDISDLAWYQAFALWRLACICEGIYARYRSGAMGDDGFDIEEQGRQVLALVHAADQLLRG